MTSIDQELDPSSLFNARPLTLYRITKRDFASLSGRGAFLFPGRWNKAREEAIYTCTERGTTILERLAHTPKDRIAANLALMTIELSGTWSAASRGAFDPGTGATFQAIASLSKAARLFHPDYGFSSPFESPSTHPFAVAVPSVIAPVWNVVLYPNRLGFWQHVSLASVEPFTFDPRLFPEDAKVEASA